MNSKQKIAFYVALIFLAGGVAGGSIAWTASTKQQGPPPRREFPDAKRMCDFMKKRLQERVGLTAAQVEKIEPLLEESARDLRAIHDRTLQEVEEVIRRTHTQIAATLTPEQNARLEEVERERREFWRKHFKKKEHKDRDGGKDQDGDKEGFWEKKGENRVEPGEESDSDSKGPNACNRFPPPRRPACV